ncbi:hypothetical protein HMPREF1870_00783 [Bacteroidales bacterium KA00344]|nr:hypothetical protein HMPREF1870_00783 [Bacteroidales bacterium KA00344]
MNYSWQSLLWSVAYTSACFVFISFGERLLFNDKVLSLQTEDRRSWSGRRQRYETGRLFPNRYPIGFDNKATCLLLNCCV